MGVDRNHRRQQREGNRHERHDHAAQIAQEKKQHYRNQHRPDEDIQPDAMQGVLDEGRRTVQARVQPDSARLEARLELLERRLQRAGDLQGVGSVLAREIEQHTGFAHDERVAELGCRALGHRREIMQPQWDAARERNHGFPQGGGAEGLAAAFNQHALIRGLDEAAAAHSRSGPHGRHHVAEGKIARNQLARLDLDFDLPLISSVEGCPGDARHGEQPRPYRPLHQIAQLHRRQLVAHEPELQQIHRGGHERRELRGLHTQRQARGHFPQGLRDNLP